MLRLLSVLTLATACSGSPIAPTIMGGADAEIADFPYIVSIEMNEYYHLCGAVIVSPDWALTDAECTSDAINITAFSVRSSSSFLYNGTLHNISQWIHHPRSDNFDREYNFAMIQVDPPFEFDENVSAATLVDQGQVTPDGAEALIAGWGKSSNISEWFTDHLQFGQVTVLDEAGCSDQLGVNYHESKLCAQDRNGQVTHCSFDEGGPLVINGTLYGIMSWPGSCGDSVTVHGYSRVASVRSWIDETIGVTP